MIKTVADRILLTKKLLCKGVKNTKEMHIFKNISIWERDK